MDQTERLLRELIAQNNAQAARDKEIIRLLGEIRDGMANLNRHMDKATAPPSRSPSSPIRNNAVRLSPGTMSALLKREGE